MGQLLVVVHHTDNSPSLCYEPELIPDPLWYGLEGDHIYNGSGISSQPGTNWSGNSVGTVWVAGIPGISETRSN